MKITGLYPQKAAHKILLQHLNVPIEKNFVDQITFCI